MLALLGCMALAAVLSVFVGRQVSAGGAPSASGSASPWTGVAELVSAKVSSNGAVTDTPKQRTWVTASHAGKTQIYVPVSSKPEAGGLFKKFKHPTPSADGVLDFSPSGEETSTQSADSRFTKALPILVVPKYELNGEPVAAPQEFKNLGSRGGLLHVTYTFYDVAQETTAVHFKGLGGVQRTRTIKQAVPIAGELHVTLPKEAMGLSAPGASVKSYPLYGSEVKLSSKDTARATWTFALAPPLTPATHSVSYSIKLDHAEVPKAELDAEVITIPPKSEGKSSKSTGKGSHGGGGSGHGSKGGKRSTGKKNSQVKTSSKGKKSSVGRGHEQARHKGGGSSASALGESGEQPEGTRRERQSRERRETEPRGERSGSPREERKALATARETLGSESAFEAPGGLGEIPERSATEFANVQTNVATDIGEAAAATRGAIAEVQHRLRGLATGQAEALKGSAASAETGSEGLAEESQGELNGLSSEFASGQERSNNELGRAVAKATLALTLIERRSSDHRDELRRHVAAALILSSAASALRDKANALREAAAQHVSEARALKQEIGHAVSDLAALGEHGTLASTRVTDELTLAEERAGAVLAGASGLEARLGELATSAANLQDAAGGLVLRAEEAAATAATIREAVHARVAGAVEELEAHLAGFKDRGRHLHEQIEAASADVAAARVRAKAKFAAVKGEIAGHLAALEAKVSAAAGAARAAAQQKVEEAESEYAQLLALVQIGRANNLPGGNAKGATVQTGIYLYEIAGSKE